MTETAAAEGGVKVDLVGHVATVEFSRPPTNFFDLALIGGIADALEALDKEPLCRAVVLASSGRIFCAGADLANPSTAVHDITSPFPPPRWD